MMKQRGYLLLLLVLLITAIFYLPGFNGYWLGDDFSNLHRSFVWQEQGTLWSSTLNLFIAADTSQGAFYRPLMMLGIALNYAIAGENYGGWFALNFLIHLANTALIALLVVRLAEWLECEGYLAGLMAALFFGLNPVLSEGVYWVSARADGCVTLLSLLSLHFWAGPHRANTPKSAYLLPILLIAALGFKESAAVLPLQMLLILLVWPDQKQRSRVVPVVLCFVFVAVFLAWRTHLFGDAWTVYTSAKQDSALTKLHSALLSLPDWWRGLLRETPQIAPFYLAALAASILASLRLPKGKQRWIVLALIAASGGMALATLLNLGAMSAAGEGGRLAYNPAAWLALALGLAMATDQKESRVSPPFRHIGKAPLVLTIVLGAFALHAQLQSVWAAQKSFHALASEMPGWAQDHQGLTLLFIPEQAGMVILGRNGQGGLALQPVQALPLLHRIVPTLPSEIAARYTQFAHGFGRRLIDLQPHYATVETIKTFLEPTEAYWHDHLACWSMIDEKFIVIAPPDTASEKVWVDAVRGGIGACGL